MTEDRRVDILGASISAVTLEEALRRIERWLAEGGSHYACFTNVHAVVLSRQDSEFRRITNEANLALPDGMPVVWASRLLGRALAERVDGPGLMLALCERSAAAGHSHYFYGGGEGVAELLAQRMVARFPGLKVAGCHCPPFRPLTPAEDEDVVTTINNSSADIVWVGLGAPKQERWMAGHVGRIEAPMMLGVGAAFDFHAGVARRAPALMRRVGLEWLFRLLTHPRRLWRRYLATNSKFLCLLARELLRRG
ncbi:MAG: WecB/TagA/CpsF family glycosyltransferase [Planctomycetota bacterium]|jgi:N-acetylglucosaminyldiphosphoundecaprenol N-acetyl-beta-D-mannosaminyltransferase